MPRVNKSLKWKNYFAGTWRDHGRKFWKRLGNRNWRRYNKALIKKELNEDT